MFNIVHPCGYPIPYDVHLFLCLYVTFWLVLKNKKRVFFQLSQGILLLGNLKPF